MCLLIIFSFVTSVYCYRTNSACCNDVRKPNVLQLQRFAQLDHVLINRHYSCKRIDIRQSSVCVIMYIIVYYSRRGQSIFRYYSINVDIFYIQEPGWNQNQIILHYTGEKRAWLVYRTHVAKIQASASEMNYIVSGGALNSTHSLTYSLLKLSIIEMKNYCIRANENRTGHDQPHYG